MHTSCKGGLTVSSSQNLMCHQSCTLTDYYELQIKLDVHRTHTPRCEVKKIIALWRMHAVMQGWKEVRVVKTE